MHYNMSMPVADGKTMVAVVGLAVLGAFLYRRSCGLAGGSRRSRGHQAHSTHSMCDGMDDIPEEFRDPISFGLIAEPVILCATGQIYCHRTLREWFKTGSRVCPRTGIKVLDVQLTRLPWFKQKILEWCELNGVPQPEADPMSPTAEQLKAVHPSLPSWIADVCGDSGNKRIKAAADLYELVRKWEGGHGTPEQLVQARGAMMEGMVWLLRYGDTYLQGVAASILSYCDTPDEVQWLAPTAAVPAVLLCLSPSNYTSQAATRLLYNISRAGSAARRTIHMAGGVLSLLKIISTDRQEYGYSRDRAAATLAIVAKEAEIRAYLKPLALGALKEMLLTNPGEDRWEKRDAATALLALQYSQEELGSDVTVDQLFKFFWCSRAWLESREEHPDQGYSEEEKQARTNIAFWQANALALIEQLLARDIVAEPAPNPAEAGGDQGQGEGDGGEQGEVGRAAGAEVGAEAGGEPGAHVEQGAER